MAVPLKHCDGYVCVAGKDRVPGVGVAASVAALRPLVRAHGCSPASLPVVRRARATEFSSGVIAVVDGAPVGVFRPQSGWKMRRITVDERETLPAGVITAAGGESDFDRVRAQRCMDAKNSVLFCAACGNPTASPRFALPPCEHPLCSTCNADPPPACRRCGAPGEFLPRTEMHHALLMLSRRSVDDVRAGAAGGDVDSIALLAFMMGVGLRVEKDVHESMRLYRIGAEGGNHACQYSLANYIMALDGDARAATPWLRLAAAQGNVGAMHNLAVLLAMEDEPDDAEINRLLDVAAARGHPGARHMRAMRTNL
jgi:hypothetical protein